MLVAAPSRLDEYGFEDLLKAVAGRDAEVPGGIDCSHVRFADPCGILMLLAVGLSGAFRRDRAWGLVLPRDPPVLAYLERSGARRLLERLFVVEGASRQVEPEPRESHGPVLLEIAVVRESGDVHRAVARIKARADLLLVERLGYSPLAADRFSVAMAEICQNIVDHSGSPGLAAAQCYVHGHQGTPEVRLAVADAGIGMRDSLAPRYARDFTGAWTDLAAVRLAFQRGVSRFDDPDRGLGLKAVADMVRGWGGTLRIRSGSAAFVIGRRNGAGGEGSSLAHFPGTQISVRLPGAPGFVVR